MLRSLTSGVSAMQQFQQQMDVIGNNIANVNTTAFKGARIDFEDSFSQTLSTGSGGSSMQVGTGVGTSAISNQFIQGAISNTGNNADLAITRNGFFVVRDSLNNSDFATRDGSFHIDNGFLVNSSGMRVQGFSDSSLTTRGDVVIDGNDMQATRVATANAAITAANAAVAAANPADPVAVAAANLQLTNAQASLTTAQSLKMASFNIDPEGKINLRLSDGTEYVRGQVLLQNFSNPQALSKEGSNLFSGLDIAGALPQTAAPGTNGLGAIQSGALEGSNVDLANEFSSLITTQRAFQASARIITTSDEILQELVNLKR
ncbi:MAG: flagellar hook-basal body complex protein [Akkermansiaceae bacterium]|nr:flagellar hook-basal body complex protein [Verrucomicrobiales bacterium]